MNKRSKLPRRAWAMGVAVCAHLVALLGLGWRIPKAAAPLPADTLPPLEIRLLRPPVRQRAPARPAPPKPAPSPPSASARVLITPTPGAPPLSAPVQSPPAPALATGAPDCEPEDLPLLTDAEKALCRNQIDADKGRRLARGADARAANEVAEAQRGPQAYRMDSDKEAYYGAVAQAYYQQSHGPWDASRRPGFKCSLSGPKAKAAPGTLALGRCVFFPGQGFLTEESVVAPP